MIKPCFKCGVVKPIEEFNKHKRMSDGHLNKCKLCEAAYKRNRVDANAAERKAAYKLTPKGRVSQQLENHRRRARQYGVEATLTREEWARTLARHDHRCAYCGVGGKLEQDCVVSISKGGAYTEDNVVPACQHCNRVKTKRDVCEFMMELL